MEDEVIVFVFYCDIDGCIFVLIYDDIFLIVIVMFDNFFMELNYNYIYC